MDGAQRRRDLLAVEHIVEPVQPAVPLGQDLVDQATVAGLVLELLVLGAPIERLDPLAQDADGTLAGDEWAQDGAVRQVDALDEELAVEQVLVDPGPATLADDPELGRERGVADRVCHARTGVERAEVEPGQPAVRAEELHVEGVVLSTPEHAGPVRIPAVGVVGAPGVLDGAPHVRPQVAQPVRVARQAPVAVQLHDIAELAIRTWPFRRVRRAQWQAEPKTHPAGVVLVVAIVHLAHRALQAGEEERQCLGVVPDVRTAAFAGAGRRVAALPAIERAVLETQRRRRLERREVGRGGVEDRARERGAIQRVAKGDGPFTQVVPARQDLRGDRVDAGPLGAVPVPPLATRTRRLAEVPDGRDPVLAEVGRVPADDEADRPPLPRRRP